MDLHDEVSESTISNIIWDIREEIAKPDETKRVLRYLCLLIDERKPLTVEVRRFLREGIGRYLDGDVGSIDQGLGVVRGKGGRPSENEELQCQMAASVLSELLRKKNLEEAYAAVAPDYNKSEYTIRDAWIKRKPFAIDWLLAKRTLLTQEGSFTTDEKEILRRVYKKESQAWERFIRDEPPTISTEN